MVWSYVYTHVGNIGNIFISVARDQTAKFKDCQYFRLYRLYTVFKVREVLTVSPDLHRTVLFLCVRKKEIQPQAMIMQLRFITQILIHRSLHSTVLFLCVIIKKETFMVVVNVSCIAEMS